MIVKSPLPSIFLPWKCLDSLTFGCLTFNICSEQLSKLQSPSPFSQSQLYIFPNFLIPLKTFKQALKGNYIVWVTNIILVYSHHGFHIQLDNNWAAGPENMYRLMEVRKILGSNGTGAFSAALDHMKDYYGEAVSRRYAQSKWKSELLISEKEISYHTIWLHRKQCFHGHNVSSLYKFIFF